ncbi:MAG: methyl-accepting chemotaxis protein [Bacillota bacterium]|nr:methyl-accepting chemotaxis protein [Bacillota bacterium]
MSVRAKFAIMFLAIISLSIIGALSMYFFMNSQNQYSSAINMAGRQRALSQQMMKAQMLGLATGNDAHLIEANNAKELFEVTIDSFFNGNQELGIEQITDEAVYEQVQQLEKAWQDYINELNLINSTNYQSQSTLLNEKNIAVFKEADKLTGMMENLAHEKSYIPMIMMVVSVCLTLIIGLTYWILVDRKIVKPIVVLSTKLQLVAEGDLTQTVEINSKDEIGSLGIAFQMMMVKLKELISETRLTSEQLASASQEVSASVDENTKAAEQIAFSAQEVAQAADQQLLKVSQVNDLVLDLEEQVKQAEQSLEKVQTVTDEGNQAAGEGEAYVNNTVSQIEHVAQVVTHAAGTIKQLGEESKKVGDIVAAISDIADQTNLLALNAAIEAARAGEQGRGFAVVAEEVRKLAEQSSNSTEEIRRIIYSIQQQIKHAIEAMVEGNAEVTKGLAQVQETGSVFKNITRIVNNISLETEKVVAVINKVVAANQTVVQNARDMASITEGTVANSQEVAAASEEQIASMEEITSSTTMLAEMATKLDHMISKFKV